MDKDRRKGAVKKAGGEVKEVASKMTGDKTLEAKGKRDQVEGTIQDAWGKSKDVARDIANRDR